jgi:NitT/TauT family transport system substrate-binding protein
MRRKLVTGLVALAMTAYFVTGCGSVSEEGDSAGSGSSSANNEETVSLAGVCTNTSVGHLNTILAKTAGLYEKEGVDVDLTYLNTGNADIIQSVLSGKADFGASGSTSVLTYIDQGEDIVIIGGAMTNGASMYCLPERAEEFSEINEETLAGKKIGVTRMQSGDIAFRAYLNDQGVDLSKIEFVELDNCNTIIEATLKGEIDLGIVFMTYRPIAEEQGLAVAAHLDDLYNNFICCRLFTTQKELEANREAFVKLVKAQIEAYNIIQTNPEETHSALSEIEFSEEDFDLLLYDYGHLTNNPNPARTDIEKFYISMLNIGYVENGVDVDEYIDTTVFEDALGELLEEEPDNEIYKELKKLSDETNPVQN